MRLLSPIEVARGSTLLGQMWKDQELKPALELVQLKEIRCGQKWRFPSDFEHVQNPVADASALADILSCSSVRAGEPVEYGSFLLAESEAGSMGQQTVYRVTWQYKDGSAGNMLDELSGGISSNRCFIFRKEFLELLRLQTASLDGRLSAYSPTLVSDSQDNINLGSGHDELRCISCELFSTPQLINFLPELSLVCTDLAKHCLQESICHDAIVAGESGSGKTHTALVLAAYARFSTVSCTYYLDCKKLKDGRGIRMKQILTELQELFHTAKTCSGNSMVLLDDLDELAPNLDCGSSSDNSAQTHQVNPIAVDQSKLIADTMRQLIESASTLAKRVSVIITCRDSRRLPASILSVRPFTRKITTPALTSDERVCLLWRMIHKGLQSRNDYATSLLQSIRVRRKTEGFRPKDLSLLASRVRHLLHSIEDEISPAGLVSCTEMVLKDFKPLRQLALSETAAGAVEWSDIGGLFYVKEELTTIILKPAKYRRIFEKAKIRLPRGVLLFGPPGLGKSYLVPALAKKCGFSLITCRGPELLDRYIGASESKVRELFARATAASPSILFFDEIDSLAPRRGSDRTGVTDRVVNQLLTLLDGVEETAAGGVVYVVAATSRPDIVDPALLRPGRLEKHIFVGYPEGTEEFTDLLMKVSARYATDPDIVQLISSGKLIQEVQLSTTNYQRLSAADLKAAFDTAQLNSIHEILQTESGKSSGRVSIRLHHILGALRSTRPSLPERDFSMLMEAYRPFRKDLTVRPRGDGDSASGTNRRSFSRGGQKQLRTALK
jgi:SpoVK/Ycf46/Vps4 family AAA+-type ATPase